MFNHVGLLGRLAQEPEIRYTTGGTPVARFDLAVPCQVKRRTRLPTISPLSAGINGPIFAGSTSQKGGR